MKAKSFKKQLRQLWFKLALVAFVLVLAVAGFYAIAYVNLYNDRVRINECMDQKSSSETDDQRLTTCLQTLQ